MSEMNTMISEFVVSSCWRLLKIVFKCEVKNRFVSESSVVMEFQPHQKFVVGFSTLRRAF